MKIVGSSLVLCLWVSLLMGQSLSTRKGGHSFTLDVPTTMVRAFDINSSAALQYEDTASGAFIMVIEDEKAALAYYGVSFNSISDYLNQFTHGYLTEVPERKISAIETFQNGIQNVAQCEMTYRSEDGSEAYAMLITGVETPTYFYKIIGWTPKPLVNVFMPVFKQAARTLKE